MIKSRDKLKSILKNINSIALIGASANSDRDSFKVMEYLISSDIESFQLIQTFKIKILGRGVFHHSGYYRKTIWLIFLEIKNYKRYYIDAVELKK